MADETYFQCLFSCKTLVYCVVIGIILYFCKNVLNDIYKKYSAWIMNSITLNIKAGFKDEKTRIFNCLNDYYNQHKSNDFTVLEVGAGTAPNLAFLPPNIKLVCLEPNIYFDKYAKENVKTEGNLKSVDFVHGYAENMPFEDETFDAVVCTLVLCCVKDTKKCLQEFKRVLKPGGKYIFLEHVGHEDKNSWSWMGQRCINPLQQLMCDGCDTTRDTETYINAAGFSDVDLRRFPHKPFPIWFRPCISGNATK